MDVDGIGIAKALEIENASIVEGVVNAAGNLVLKNKGGTEFNAGSVIRPPKIELFTDFATTLGFELEPGAQLLHVQAIGGGGGGAAGTVSGGDQASGGGGSGGGWNELWLPATALAGLDSDFFRIDVGEGGEGGAFSGATGNNGESSEFWYNDGGSHRSLLFAFGGKGGLPVSPATSGEQPVAAGGNLFAGSGGSGRGDFATPLTPAGALRGGGGGGGGLSQGSASIANGGVGGAGAGSANPSILTAQLPFYLAIPMGGGGGFGGGSHTTPPVARNGSDGGLYGGGGGGGAGINLNFGNGGKGAQGMVLIVTYF